MTKKHCILWTILIALGLSFGISVVGTCQCRWEQEGNDLPADADSLGEIPGGGCRSGMIDKSDDLDYFWFVMNEPGAVIIETESDGDTVLFLYDALGNRLAEDDDSGADFASRIAATLDRGTYFVIVGGVNGETISSYVISLSDSSYGKSRGSTSCLPEVEDNDSAGQSDSLQPTTDISCRLGSISPLYDIDVYHFSVRTKSEVTIQTITDGDTVLTVYDQSGQRIAADDDSGQGAGSLLTLHLYAGTYYAVVEDYGGDETIDRYQIHLDSHGWSGTVDMPEEPDQTTPTEYDTDSEAPPWGWSIQGPGRLLAAWGVIDKPCPSDYALGRGDCDKKTFTFNVPSRGYVAMALIDEAGQWIGARMYDSQANRFLVKEGVAAQIYTGWAEVIGGGPFRIEVVPYRRLDRSYFELHVFFSTTLPDAQYLERTYGPATMNLTP